MLKDLSGVGGLQESLATTNALLADVLAELKQTNSLLTETNSQRLESIATELRTMNGGTTPEA